MTDVTGSMLAIDDFTRKHECKSKDCSQRQSVEHASTATTPLNEPSASTFKSSSRIHDNAASNSCDEPAAKKAKLARGRRLRGSVINDNDLSWPSKSNHKRSEDDLEQVEKRLNKMRDAVRTLLECVGENPDREGLLDTPARYAKTLLFLTKGYQSSVEDIVGEALFLEGHNEMVIVKDIEIHSLCEHHLVPFTGKVRCVHV